MSKDLLNIIEAVANEKEVDRSVIIEALEAALAAATRKRYPDEEIGAKVVINPRTGEYKSFRLWTVVDDEAILENPDAEMRESVAAIEFPEAHLQVGDVHEVRLKTSPSAASARNRRSKSSFRSCARQSGARFMTSSSPKKARWCMALSVVMSVATSSSISTAPRRPSCAMA